MALLGLIGSTRWGKGGRRGRARDSNPLAARRGSTNPPPSGSFESHMSVRYDLRQRIVPASAGHASFAAAERMLAATNDPRS